MKAEFLGYNLVADSIDSCAREIDREASSGRKNCKIIACLNPHSYAVARSDATFRIALQNADWLIPDGAGVIMAAKWLGIPLPTRIAGPDLFVVTMNRLNKRGGSVFFLGSSEQTLIKIRSVLALEFPQIELVGTYSPPFKDQFSAADTAAMVDAVNSARPDVLWVGMTAPKQEKWLAENRSRLQVGVAGAVGAAFDFFAGTVSRSPKLTRDIGLEWLPRLIQQPRRLWRRMFVSAPIFLFDVYHSKSRKRTRE